MITKNEIIEFFKMNSSGNLHHREGQKLEFKESFNYAGLDEYLKDFSAFANNKGGILVFGVSDSPRTLVGLSNRAKEQFEKIDPERISGFLLDIFSGHFEWEASIIDFDSKYFGVFKISEAFIKPIISKKDAGKEQTIKNGEIYFRYGGRTQKIRFPELEAIINYRIKQNNDQWLDLMSKIGSTGPQNAAILDTERSVIEKGESQVIVIDEELATKLRFIKEGEFSEKKGATTLKLVGSVMPVNQVEVVKRIKENLFKEYPLSATELADEIKIICPECPRNNIWKIIKENDLKNNSDYAVYNFRNKSHEDHYKENGALLVDAPSIYKRGTIDFIINLFKQQ